MDYEICYEPGKDEKDPLDFLSRHPLPETGGDGTEAMIKYTVNMEHAVVLPKILEETEQDAQLTKLKEIMLAESWEKHKSDPDIAPFYGFRQEISTAEGLMFD